MSIKLYPGDNRESLRKLIAAGVRVHAVVCDPPYGLTSVTKRFGKEGSAPARSENNDGSFARLSAGFMGSKWDGTGIERDPEFWKLVYEILLPGGYVFAFSGARTGHWQACAMETAGFIMHPMHGWVFGSGFPKAHNASKAIDKHLGVKGTYEGTKAGHHGFKGTSGSSVRSLKGTMGGEGGFARPWMDDPEAIDRYHSAYMPASPEAEQWQGWAYGAQAQKPALEPIYLGQKPYSEKTGAANLLKHGVGAVNIDGCRVPTSENLGGGAYAKNPTGREQMWGSEAGNSWKRGGAGEFVQPEGRHPANLLLDGSPEVVALFPQSKGQIAKASTRTDVCKTQNVYGAMAHGSGGQEPRNDTGSAARFFHRFPHDNVTSDHVPIDADPIIYNRKAGIEDRAGSCHPTVKPIALIEYLIRHITPQGGVVLDPFAGSGTTAEAARRLGHECILMEAEPSYVDFITARFDLKYNVGIYSSLTGEPVMRNDSTTGETGRIRVDDEFHDGSEDQISDLDDLLSGGETPQPVSTFGASGSDSDLDLDELLV